MPSVELPCPPENTDDGGLEKAREDLLHSQALMRRSELRYRRLFEASRDGVLLVDPASRKILDANPFMTELLGYPHDALLGKELFEIGLLKDEAASRVAFKELQTRGFIRYDNLPLETSAGLRREVEFISNLYQEGNEHVIQCNIRDVTTRKRAERELSEKARLIDLSNDAIIVCDLEDRISLWNKGAELLYGWTFGEVIGKRCLTLLQTEFPKPREEILAQLHRDGRFSGEVTQTARGGRRIPSLCRWVLDLEAKAILTSYTDITANREAELEMAQARDQAVAASRAKDEFLAALSHELRTPLSPVLLLAEEGADNPAMPAAARAIFATIVKNIKLEARLIDDLLDLTRITHGKMLVEQLPVDIHLALQDALETVQSEVAGKLTVKLKLMTKKPWAMGDPVRLQQIFWNVLRNAAKFTPSGGEIAVETQVLADGSLSIRIADTGIGLAPLELERIFASFSQGDHAGPRGSHRFGGLGLGLAISRMLAELHGGTIRAESAGLGQGSTFIIALPLLRTPNKTDFAAEKHPAHLPLLIDTANPRPVRILLVEDHEATRGALTQLLLRRHYEVVAVSSLAAARAANAGTLFDLMITDIGLPDGNGHELMAELHARSGLQGIALTGYGQEEDLARSRAAGFIAHLTKPVSIQSLENALASVISHRASSPAPRTRPIPR